MNTNKEVNQNEALRITEELKKYVPESTNLITLWERSESKEALQLVQEAGYSPDEFLDEADLGLHFSNPKGFYQAYVAQIRPDLCKQSSNLRKSVDAALGAGTTSLLAILAEALAIPGGAVMLIAPIAAVLLVKGIDTFCEMEVE